MEKDPVCGMTVENPTSELSSEHMGKTYYFCGPGCKKAFDNDPHKYVSMSGEHMDHEHH